MSVKTMMNMERPTDTAPIMITIVPHPVVPWVPIMPASSEQPMPVKIPVAYPPIKDLVLAENALGAVNTIKDEAPMDAMMAV